MEHNRQQLAHVAVWLPFQLQFWSILELGYQWRMAREAWVFDQLLNPEAIWLKATRVEKPPLLFWQLLVAQQLIMVVTLLSLDESFGTLLETALPML